MDNLIINRLQMQQNPKEQLPINVIANISYFALNVGIGLWLVPYLIAHLGIAVYGVIPLAISMSAYMGLVTTPISISVSRFLTIDLKKGDFKTANQTFNTAFFGLLTVSLFILPFILIGSFFVPDLLNIPDGYENVTRILFFFVLSAFLVTVVSGNFSVSAFSQNRLELTMMTHGIGLVSRVLVIVSLFTILTPQLWHVGIGFFMGALFTLGGAVWIWRRLTPELNIKRSYFDQSRLYDLLGMGGWVFVNQIGTLLFLNIDLIVVNRLFGAESGGYYGSVLQWVILLRALSGILSGVLTPTILAYHAEGKSDQLIRLSKLGINGTIDIMRDL